MKTFSKPFTQQEPIPEAAITRAVEVLRGGRLHRYNVEAGETAEAALLEQEFATYQGARYCLACASGGYALQVALRSAGLRPGATVLTNAFTLAPVPGAIDNAGGRALLVETGPDLCIDLTDLKRKATANPDAGFLLLSHMRGHIADMDQVVEICNDHGLVLIEDCAHTMGAAWDGRKSGSFGKAACFSTQTYKHLNSGEGGLITSDDEQLMARAVLHSGSYMLYERHLAAPSADAFRNLRLVTPNYSGRMDNLRAAILREQLKSLDANAARWNQRYAALAEGLSGVSGLTVPARPDKEHYVASSLQFLLDEIGEQHAPTFLASCAQRGVEVKWFGAAEPNAFTSRFDSWHYLEPTELPKTRAVLTGLFDMRIPLTFSVDDCRQIAEIIVEALAETCELTTRYGSVRTRL